MAALSNTEAAALLNESLRSETVYIGLFLTDPTAGATGQEASGGGYARKVITFGAPSLASGKQQVSNTAVISWPAFTADIGTIGYWAIFDAVSGGNQKWQGAFSQSKLVQTDDAVQLEIGAITINLS